MGSFFSCCESEIKPLKCYPNLYKASKMTTTVRNERITKHVIKKLTTRAQRNGVRDDPYVSRELKLICSEPYNSFDKITDNIYLTGSGGMIMENIINLKITCIINATYEAPNYEVKGIECIRIPVNDDKDYNISIYFDEVSNKLTEVTNRNARAVVHCVAGISRSSTLVLAHLIKSKKMSLKNAFILVKSKRKLIQPNNAFFKQLIEYEKKVLKTNSVKMVDLTVEGYHLSVPDLYKQYPDIQVKALIEAKNIRFSRQSIVNEYSERSGTLTDDNTV